MLSGPVSASSASLLSYLNTLVQVCPKSKYSKSIIAQAIALGVVGLYLYNNLVPPAKLRQYPSINPFKYLYHILTGTDGFRYARDLVVPVVRDRKAKAYVTKFPSYWTVNIVDPVAAKALLMKYEQVPKSLKVLHKLNNSHPFVRFVGHENAFFSIGDVWKAQRRILNPAFRRTIPVALFGKLTQKAFEKIDAEPKGSPAAIVQVFDRMMLDMLALGLYSIDFQALDNGHGSEWLKPYDSIRKVLREHPVIFFLPRLENWLMHFLPSRKRLAQDVNFLNAKFADITGKRRQEIRERMLAEGTSRDIIDDESIKDMLTRVIEAELQGAKGLDSPELLRSNIALFFFAGQESNVNSLAFTLYNLATHPDIQERARQEALRVLGSEPTDIRPTPEQCKEFTYIDMVIKENLRLYPPSAVIAPRRATQDILLGDVFVPKGTEVNIDINVLHRHPDIWPDPERFDPERFADNGKSRAHEGLAWIPFGNGGRQCIGMNFSLAVQRTVLSMFLRRYNITLPSDSHYRDGIPVNFGGAFAPEDLTLCFERRY